MCTPKITNTCQKPPINRPNNAGLILKIALVSHARIFEIQVASGPITRKVNGAVISNVINGTRKDFTTAGEIFFANFSTLDANHTDKIIGITVDE